jgi:hypothetical protein
MESVLPTITWAEHPTCFKVSLPNCEDTLYRVGDTVQSSDRTDFAVVITEIIGYYDDVGPLGFIYLPWRDEEKRWASKAMTLKGDPRFVVCYPSGNRCYGQHIDWKTFRHAEHPDKEHPDFAAFIQKLTKK